MIDRRMRAALGLGLAALGLLVGCEPFHRGALRREGAGSGVLERSEVIGGLGDEPTAEARGPEGHSGFFKPTRRPGALSEEAREIEADLGVMP